MKIHLYTDGGCRGNPGPGGWAAVMEDSEGKRTVLSGREAETTNNRMELTAVIQGLSYIKNNTPTADCDVSTDSQYVKNGITQWIHNWERNGWRTAAKKPVKNADLWKQLRELDTALKTEWHWVRGHSGHEQNEMCDFLVNQEMDLLN